MIDAVGNPQSLLLLGGTSDIALAIAQKYLADAPELRVVLAALTSDLLARFAEDVMAGRWQGNKQVLIAPEDPGGALVPFPEGYDHLRAIPVQRAAT